MASEIVLDPNASDSVKQLTSALLETREEPKGKPRLLLAIIGDSSSFVPKPWLTPVLQLGLIETAIGAKDCLILYKGSEEKISSLIWEAVDDCREMHSHQGTDPCVITLVGLAFEGVRSDEMYRQLHVSIDNFNETMNKKLEDYFEEFGEMEKCHFMKDSQHKVSGTGIVTYKNACSLDNVLTHRPHILDGTRIKTKRAMVRPDVENEMYRKLHVSIDNFNETVNKKLEDYFEEFGEIEKCHFMKDSKLPELGTGIVTYKDACSLDKVQAHRPHMLVLDGIRIGTKRAMPTVYVREKYYGIRKTEDEETDAETYELFHVDFLADIASNYVPFVELKEEQSLSMKLPVLVIVAEGDLKTIHHVLHVIKKDIPVLILQGSGKAADLIAECIGDTDSVETKAPLLFGIYFQKDDFKDLKENLDEIATHKHFVNIFNINEQDETQFSDAVVNAIIRAWAHSSDKTNERVIMSAIPQSRYKINVETSDSKEMESISLGPSFYQDLEISPTPVFANGISGGNNISLLGMRGSSVRPSTVTLKNVNVTGEVKDVMDFYQNSLTPASLPLYFYIAYQFIQELPIAHKEEKTKSFQILLRQAMIADRVDYVKVLLQEEKVEFDRQQLPTVYEQTVDCGCDNYGDCQHIMSILKSASEKSAKELVKKRKIEIDGETKQKIVKNYEKCLQSGRQLCQKFLHYPGKKYENQNEQDQIKAKQKKEMYQDLLIWALFANRRKLATLFWTKCENQLLTAILASCVLKTMAWKAKSGKDQFLYNSVKEHSRIFGERALDLQTKLYEEDPEIAMELLLTEQTVWNITVSPLECAFDNAMLDFIAHSCAQRRLNKFWYKNIGTNLGDYWKKGVFCGCKREERGEEKALLLRKFIYAPLTRFLVHYIIFIAALVCYSAFLLTELSAYENVGSIKTYEWLIYVWLLGDILEEYRLVLPWNNDVIRSRFSKKTKDRNALNHSVKYRLKRYFYDFWNALDFVSFWVTIAAVLVRFLNNSDDGAPSRRLYSLSLFTMYMRFLHALLMSRKLGPKIIMIKEMLKDLFRFIGILFVFMVGVGVLYHANMYPAHVDMWNTDGWTYWRIWKIIYIPYWQIYGSLFLDQFEANSTQPCTTNITEWESNGEIERCNQYDWVLIVIAAFYMLISNLLLVNLVIALFSYRFEIVQANSEKLWRYWRYAVVMDYRTRVPAPLNLVIRPFMSMVKCIRKCVKENHPNDSSAIRRMERLQDISANKCVRNMNEG